MNDSPSAGRDGSDLPATERVIDDGPRRAIVIMAKRPEPGATKTRLAPMLGAEGAAALYERFLLDTIATATSVPGVEVVIAHHPADAEPYFRALAPGARFVAQVGDDLGHRLDRVIRHCLDGRHDQVVAINSDSPHLPPVRLVDAFAALGTGGRGPGVVLGPANDGGYYLIGLSDRPGRLVTGVTMSTPTVLADTMTMAASLDRPVTLLPETYDIDEPADLVRLRYDLDARPDSVGAPQTRRLLAEHPLRVAAVIPALDEEATIATAVQRCAARNVAEVIVVDNGSSDATAGKAEGAGAIVVTEARRGYGHACAAGVAEAARRGADVVVFLDGDLSSPPEELEAVTGPVVAGDADLVLGSRVRGSIEAGSMPVHQRLGNTVSAWLMARLYGLDVTDLGPMRAVRTQLVIELDMRELTYGWPTEMTVKAARAGARIVEVPVSWHRRAGGRSKVSGTIRGSLLAARHIVATTLRYSVGRRP